LKKSSLFLFVFLLAAFSYSFAETSPVKGATTAWKGGSFHLDTPGVIGRSDIVLSRPNTKANQAMPLGNGRLGVAVWSEDGLTVQLNRVDTLPGRLSPGWVVIPGLSKLTSAADYSGRLDLYDGSFTERGNGMTATVYVQPESDTLIVDITGADPKSPQTALLKLWTPRAPRADTTDKTGFLAEHWMDDKNPGASGRAFGSLSAITADGRDISVAVKDPLTIAVTVTPYPDGHFRILAAAPHYDGKQDIAAIARKALEDRAATEHADWWHTFWHRAGTIRITSPDGTGEYMENLRNIYLFSAAAENGAEIPGSQAGIGDLFSAVRDVHHWDPAAFWHWNLRMQIAANLGAGLPELNEPYFRLYRDNLTSIEKWTTEHMAGRPGICIPETMRFNGPGIEYENGQGWDTPVIGLNCDSGKPYYNARTISTGAEVSYWILEQYLATGNREFLARNFPVMAAAARFLLSYEKPGTDGWNHTQPSNAHETQWDVLDPITDLSARRTLYASTMQTAKLLGQEPALAQELQAALPKIPPFPQTNSTGKLELIPAANTANEQGVIATSYEPGAEQHNVENLGLEPVWPYSLIGDTSPLFALARRTYEHRPYPVNQDWSCDPIQAARLKLGSEVSKTLIKLTETYQTFVNGFANWGGTVGEFYVEQGGVTATALQEALVQDYDGTIRIAPAIPSSWDFDGSVYVRGKTKVDVQVRSGTPVTVIIEAGTTKKLQLQNPWPGQAVDVLAYPTRTAARKADASPVIAFSAIAGKKYLIQRSNAPALNLPFEAVSGTKAAAAKRLGTVQIGIPAQP